MACGKQGLLLELTTLTAGDWDTQSKRVVIAEDYRILREGLRALLSDDQSLEIVAEAEDGIEAIHCVEAHKPHLLLLDLSMPRMGGIAVIKDVKRRFPEIKLLVLTMHDSDEFILEAIRSGADGYCLKGASRGELLNAIKHVLAGKKYLCPGISEKVVDDYLEHAGKLKVRTAWETVTRRGKDVLKLVGEGHKNQEIAKRLGISVKTVEKHRANIMSKLGVHTTSAMAAYAIEKESVSNCEREISKKPR
jgi:DNA-binding NarL/FixJ family response regulator